ncbi:MAG: PKD domain-containing protein [Bacteroidota bacterium]|nr:PKD domain-containing protein [Bacteroidota bacterium]
MKMLRTLLLLLVLLPAFRLSAQCSGDYTWTVNGNQVSFSSITSPGITTIFWDFGDSGFDFTNNPSPTHTYANSGTYTACIVVTDSANCSDSSCHSIVIDSCYGSFTYNITGLAGNFYGYANGNSANSAYVWDFGDSSPGAYTLNTSHTYANPGTYNVCFAYYDLSNGCADSVCMPVTIGGCNADFTWVDSSGYVFFISSSTVGNSGNYFWDFGDGNYSNQQYPSNNYAGPGVYQVCLTVTDSLQNFCDSTCHMVTASSINAGLNENLTGITNVLLSPNPADASATVAFSMSTPGKAIISVYDITGREILSPVNQEFSSGKQQVMVNTQSFAAGTYIVQITMNGQSVKSRLIVAH